MIAVFKYSETIDPSFFDKKITYQQSSDDKDTYYAPRESLVNGKEYSIKELVERMIFYSDNRAKGLILDNFNLDFYYKVFDDLGILNPDLKHDNNLLSPREMATFFRILYNSTYLNNDNSEEALKLLSQTQFDIGLKRGIGSTPIAHKFGERSIIPGTVKQLHDCGIVYVPGRPYTLCLMTEGENFEKMSIAIAEISKIIYENISNY
jgi:beta-lactamase class A